MTKHYLVQLDGLRLIAVSCVLFGHWITYPAFKSFKDTIVSIGVNLFFVLSAFLITNILIKAKNINQNTTSDFYTLRQFYIRRFLRIFPLYYLVIVVAYIINIPTSHENIIWYLSYTTNIAWFYYGIDCGYFSHLWSLAVEEQFYLLFPLLVLFVPNKYLFKIFILIVVIAVISKLIPYLFVNDYTQICYIANRSIPGCFDCFGIGALLAYYSSFEKDKLEGILKRRLFFFICFAIYIALTFVQYHKGNIITLLFWQLSSAMCCFWLIGTASLGEFKGAVKLFLENKVVKYLGKISYGIYVFHLFIPYLLFRFGLKYYSFTGAIFVYAALYFLVTIGLSALSWHLYEHPINKLKKYIEYTK